MYEANYEIMEQFHFRVQYNKYLGMKCVRNLRNDEMEVRFTTDRLRVMEKIEELIVEFDITDSERRKLEKSAKKWAKRLNSRQRDMSN